MRKMTTRSISSSVIALALATAATAARADDQPSAHNSPMAQDARPGAGAASDAVDLSNEEIVVTARKRNESLQTVSDSISVLTETVIENADIRTLTDAVRLTPNLVVLEGLYPGYKTISFRGSLRSVALGTSRLPRWSTELFSPGRCSFNRSW